MRRTKSSGGERGSRHGGGGIAMKSSHSSARRLKATNATFSTTGRSSTDRSTRRGTRGSKKIKASLKASPYAASVSSKDDWEESEETEMEREMVREMYTDSSVKPFGTTYNGPYKPKGIFKQTDSRSFDKYKYPYNVGGPKEHETDLFGPQPVSTLKSPPKVPFGASTRNDERRRLGIDQLGFPNVAPGAYELPPAVGRQVESTKKNLRFVSFGVSARPEPERDYKKRSPGPFQYKVESATGKAPAFKVGYGQRPDLYPPTPSPGPVYEMIGYKGVGKRPPSFGFGSALRFGASKYRKDAGSPFG